VLLGSPSRSRSLGLASAAGALAVAMLGACRRTAAPPGAAPRRLEAPVPVPSPAEPPLPCTDVGALRACWSGAREATLVPRALPAAAAASPMGWRCAWPGPARLCVDRRAGAPAFTCAGARCVQAYARRPDDGEWTCVDTAGAEVCVGWSPVAGVAPARADPAWICGPRRGPHAPQGVRLGGRRAQASRSGPDDGAGDRVCVDLAPDVPDGDGGAWRCRVENGPSPPRVGERGAAAGSLGVACDGARPCVDGAVCASGRCVPQRPAPSCWLDEDCPTGACRFGTCRDEAPP
jgi:hypothetical protein